MMWTGTWNGWGASWLMLLGMILFWGGLVWAIGYVMRESRQTHDQTDRTGFR